MSKELFGNNIIPNCVYCNNFQEDNEGFFCAKFKILKNNKCRKFDYNPLLRTPETQPPMMNFKKEDFDI